MKVFVSTSGTKTFSAVDRAETLIKSGIVDIELSDGLFFEDSELKIIDLAQTSNLMLHNYFPPPKKPFVLNLASPNEDIRQRSLSLVKESIRISSVLGIRHYAFHAGFLCDPDIQNLGKGFPINNLLARSTALEIFRYSCLEIVDYAKSLDVFALVENNVVIRKNVRGDGEHPLLLAEPMEICDFLSSLGGNIGLLLDTGHWKVSSLTLGFSVEDFSNFSSSIKGLHLHSNDGDSDQHLPITFAEFSLYSGLEVDFYTLECHMSSISAIKNHFDELRSWIL